MDEHLGRLLAELEKRIGSHGEPEEQSPMESSIQGEESLSDENLTHIEKLFELAREDRSRGYELKSELDRLGVFKEYEDRFLDLFR